MKLGRVSTMEPTRTIRCIAAALMTLLCWHWPSGAGQPALVHGSYAVIARGHLTGEGHAAVGAKSVTITIQVLDADGNKGTLVAPHLTLADGRFRGTGKAMGQAITVSGRIDAPGGALRSARIVCTFSAGDGRSGRIVGDRRG